jgi:hypothetical protein
MMGNQEPLDVIILPMTDCPCGGHPDAFVDMLIYRTVPLGIYLKTEVICDITGKTFVLLPAFIEEG